MYIGIICEFDPLHSGHARLLSHARAMGADAVICAMSGNFTQRGSFAALDKRARAEMAVRCGADLVVELPTVWAMSPAETFARGGVQLLALTGVDTLLFGSECGELSALRRLADCLDSPAFADRLTAADSGATFAVRRQRAAAALLGIGALSLIIGLILKGGNADMATTIWIAAIIIFGVAEAATAGLTSIWFVLGGVAGLIAAVCSAPIWLQVALFFAVSIAALAFTRPLVVKLMKKDIKPTNADRVLGAVGRVTERIDNALPSGAVYIDGKTWTARSADGEVIEPDAAVRILRMEGVKLIVQKEQ